VTGRTAPGSAAEVAAILVRAPIGAIYAVLTDVDGWPRWWPGCTTSREPGDATAPRAAWDGGPAGGADRGPGSVEVAGDCADNAADAHLLRLSGRGRGRPPSRLRRSLHLRMLAHGWRHDVGMHLTLTPRRRLIATRGPVRSEWWLEEVPAGVVVHLVVHPGGSAALRGQVRRAFAGGLQALKDHGELAVALALGRVP
jgi:hypothetical protein